MERSAPTSRTAGCARDATAGPGRTRGSRRTPHRTNHRPFARPPAARVSRRGSAIARIASARWAVSSNPSTRCRSIPWDRAPLCRHRCRGRRTDRWRCRKARHRRWCGAASDRERTTRYHRHPRCSRFGRCIRRQPDTPAHKGTRSGTSRTRTPPYRRCPRNKAQCRRPNRLCSSANRDSRSISLVTTHL